MYSIRRNKQLILGLLTVVVLVVVVVSSRQLISSQVKQTEKQSPTPTSSPVASQISYSDRISDGDRIFINYNDESKEFQTLKNNKNFQQARNNPQFRQQGSEFCADPEPLIYLNNAQIGQKESYTIAVVAPIENQRVAALEILRGVAQAQDDINKSATKINGKLLKVIIANEKEDNTDITEGIAKHLVEDKDILGVIGHFTSDDTEKAVKIYGNPDLKEKRLVLISSTSTKPNIDNQSGYFFRTVPNNIDEAEKLADYMFKNLNQQKAAIVFNSKSEYSKSLKYEFKKAVEDDKRKGKIFKDYDLNRLKGSEVIDEANKNKIKVFMFAVKISDRKNTIFEFLDDKAVRFHYLAGDAMYDPRSLTAPKVGEILRNMVIAVPWHYTTDSEQSKKFVDKSYKLWCQPEKSEDNINWRTATSYDATNALIEAIKNNPNPTRETIQKVLSANYTMQDEGVTGKIRFKNNGDFDGESKLVKLIEKEASRTFYEFELLTDK